jgi:ABC-type Fe3+ transport system substrate-binding protein
MQKFKRFFLTLSLASSTVAAAASTQAQTVVEKLALYHGPDRAQILLECARKEGKVVFYSGMIANQALRPLIEGFSKKYPFIKAQYVRLGPSEMLQKVTAEGNANRFAVDVFENVGIETSARAANLNIPFWSPEVAAYPEQFRKEPIYWVPVRFNYLGPAYNTSLVAEADLPKTYTDLLDPKWKGKMAWSNSLQGAVLFITNLRTAWGEEKARDYLQKLSKQNVALIASSPRTVVDRVIAGEYAIALSIFTHHPVLDAKKGAPVKPLPVGPIASTVSGVMLARNPPNPHAAMLLMDYILSVEGQTVLRDAEYFPVRTDVSALDTLNVVVPKMAGIEENYISPDRAAAELKPSQEIFDKLFGTK